jgi:hypothetical protein
MGDGVGFDVGFTGVGLSLLVFVSASGFSPDNIRDVLLTGITGKEKMKDQKAVLLLVQRCHCWFKTILFLLWFKTILFCTICYQERAVCLL